MPPREVPRAPEMMWPVLCAVRELGGSATITEMDDWVIEHLEVPEEVQAIPHGSNGRQSEVQYQLAWARSNLKMIDLLDNARRAVWSITEAGKTILEAEMLEAHRAKRAEIMKRAQERRRRQPATPRGSAGSSEDEEGDPGAPDEQSWQDTLIGQLLALTPQAFERLCQRLLRESGFANVQVTGRPNDGGIDGVGVYSLSLVSFRTFFQAKRYQGTVSSSAVRDFRGAMAGRGEKGLLITTGSFTREALAEASREGAPPIELIDGNRLADLLKEHRLGVNVALVEDVAIDEEFFEDL